MNWLARLKKSGLSQSATAIPATFATVACYLPSKVATVAVASEPKQAANNPLPEPPPDPNAWRELAAAYHLHHFACPVCIAAGRGAGYGLRCGTGTALWTSYQSN